MLYYYDKKILLRGSFREWRRNLIEGSILNPLLPTLHETDILYYHPLGLHTVTMHYRIRSTVTRAVNAILSRLEPEYWTRFSSHPASLACARPTKSTPKSVSDEFHHNISAFDHMPVPVDNPAFVTGSLHKNLNPEYKTGFTKFSKNYAMTLDGNSTWYICNVNHPSFPSPTIYILRSKLPSSGACIDVPI